MGENGKGKGQGILDLHLREDELGLGKLNL